MAVVGEFSMKWMKGCRQGGGRTMRNVQSDAEADKAEASVDDATRQTRVRKQANSTMY